MLASTIIPAEQIRNLPHAIRDVANHTEADQRVMVRSGSTKTIRRKTRIEVMREAGIINREQEAACEWFAATYEQAFHTSGCTANYSGSGRGKSGSCDLLARYREQEEARENFAYARQAIPSHLMALFEAVVLGGKWPITKEDKLRFSIAAYRLYDQVHRLLEMAA
jgi:hypothetical protein